MFAWIDSFLAVARVGRPCGRINLSAYFDRTRLTAGSKFGGGDGRCWLPTCHLEAASMKLAVLWFLIVSLTLCGCSSVDSGAEKAYTGWLSSSGFDAPSALVDVQSQTLEFDASDSLGNFLGILEKSGKVFYFHTGSKTLRLKLTAATALEDHERGNTGLNHLRCDKTYSYKAIGKIVGDELQLSKLETISASKK
jgi:hypothetical protein